MSAEATAANVKERVEALKHLMQERFDRRVMDSPFVHGLETGSLSMDSVRRYYHGLVQFVLVSNRLNLEAPLSILCGRISPKKASTRLSARNLAQHTLI